MSDGRTGNLVDGKSGQRPLLFTLEVSVHNNLSIEIKARIDNHDSIRAFLKRRHADYRGMDHQVDTYFAVRQGRLKIREGTIENSLVHYNRQEIKGPKRCEYSIIHYKPGDPVLHQLKEILMSAVGILVVVNKQREIYFLDTIKVHLDTVEGLGTFFEIEVGKSELSDESGQYEQCRELLKQLNISEEHLVTGSYSDMMLAKRNVAGTSQSS